LSIFQSVKITAVTFINEEPDCKTKVLCCINYIWHASCSP